MFLKRLEIIGFKSFAERIGIDFVPGVTAIVGPNGSGKSNITDAIRWVLGEQSAKSLRGAKMEDVIFAGSDSRKPLNFAEVTLILDNSKGLFPLDYTEISVSRRVFRSGESAYLFNGQQCRLKDITDVFMDSGLGKEAFSIISQGRVDEVLNSRPENRRSIFDEAAGVLKYRTRKQKAEHKLFETADNLNRVLDILKELETRMDPLKTHAQEAESHAVITKQAREIDSSLLNYDAQRLNIELVAIKEKASQFRAEKERVSMIIDTVERETVAYKQQLIGVDNKLELLQQQLVHASAEAEKWEGRRLLSAEKERNTGHQIERLQSELLQVEQEQHIRQVKLEEASEKLSISQDSYATISIEIDRITEILKRSVKETETEIEQLKSTYIDSLNEEATLRNELKHIDERLVGEQSSSEKIVERTVLLKERLNELIKEKAEKESNLAKLNEKMKDTEEEHVQNAKSLTEREQDLRNKQELLQQAYNRQHEMSGRIRALESMEADFSGFFSGVKEVLLARKSGKLIGIKGAVAELITVDNDYVKAVETALGGAMQHIVTNSAADARKAIGYLKAKNGGRATFLPLDVMRSRKIQLTALKAVNQHPQFIGTADQLVQTSTAYQIITENLLGNVIVASSLRGASEIAKLLNYRYRIVTIDGDIVNAGGSLTGGGVKKQSSVFTRKAELETLKRNLTEMATSIDMATRSISDTKMEVAMYMETTERARKLLEKMQLELAAVASSIRETDIALRSVEMEVTTVEMGRRGAETASTELMKKRARLVEKHEQVKNTIEKLQDDIDTLERFAADWRTEEATLIAQLTEHRERAAVLREQRSYQKTTIKEIKRAMMTAENRTMALQEEIQYFTGGHAGEELSIKEIAQRIERAVLDKKELEIAIIAERKKRNERAVNIDTKEEILRKNREILDEVSAKYNAVSIKLSRYEVNYETITHKLYTEYGLRPDFDAPHLSDEQSMRETLLKIQRELAQMGPINPNAIAEYKEVSERYEFLSDQRNDLLEAKHTLQDAMTEMDEEMTARFSSTFNAVQNRFRHVFKEMFGGGDADLILTDPSNLLETGVDIVARPPGKKLQNLSLLSGGERALTAISLLFSIIEVRPVPFCILDEVEAALDEANVIRYSKYLKRFSDRTQFIVITHRKGTMEGADVLYGITMQESGVSKLISVKISEVPEEAIL